MKWVIYILISILLAGGCALNLDARKLTDNGPRFEVTYSQTLDPLTTVAVLADKNTGAEYLFINAGSVGGLCKL